MERYVLQQSQTQPNSWVCTDAENGIVCVFEDKKFNETQQVSFLNDMRPDALLIARLMREMADWLRKNHYKKIFP